MPLWGEPRYHLVLPHILSVWLYPLSLMKSLPLMWSQPYPFYPHSPLVRDRHRPVGWKRGSFPGTAQLAYPDETTLLLIRLPFFKLQLNWMVSPLECMCCPGWALQPIGPPSSQSLDRRRDKIWLPPSTVPPRCPLPPTTPLSLKTTLRTRRSEASFEVQL